MTATSADEELRTLYDAITHMPFPIVIYDCNDKIIATSLLFRQKYQCLAHLDFQNPQSDTITFYDVIENIFDPDNDDVSGNERLALEKKRHRNRTGENRYTKVHGKWERKLRSISDSGTVVVASFTIDELIKRSVELTETKRMLEFQAFHDPLTRLPNRRGLTSHLKSTLEQAQADNTKVAVLQIDLDKFKAVNDTLGHDAGDHVLKAASEILAKSIRGQDFCARVGGDEFVVVCPNIEDDTVPAKIAQNIVAQLKLPVPFEDEYCQIGASIGVIVSPGNISPDTLLSEADIALYEAKRKGRNRFEFFQPAYKERHLNMMRNVNVMREAFQLNAFEPFFQPQLDVNTGAVVGLEALARWNDREAGIRHPRQFFSMLDGANLMADLDNMIFEKAIIALANWQENGITVPQISINVSADWLNQHDIVSRVQWKIDKAGLKPGQFGIEILEEAVRQNENDQIVETVTRFADAGLNVALDHFGTGDASIASLRHFRFHRVKIDGSFANGIEQNQELRTISSAMLSLIENLGIYPMFAGIETQSQLEQLRSLGCCHMQGYAIAKPMRAATMSHWLVENAVNCKPLPRSA